jgi:hypothetical protein
MPDVKFSCSSCGQHLSSGEEGVGLVIICPACTTPLTIPSPALGEPDGLEPAEAPVNELLEARAPLPGESQPTGCFGSQHVFRWMRSGIRLGFRHFAPLAWWSFLLGVIASASAALGGLPLLFAGPALAAGFTLMLLAIARGQSNFADKAFDGFSSGHLWRSMGVVWLLALIMGPANASAAQMLIWPGFESVAMAWERGSVLLALVLAALVLPLAFAPVMFVGSRLISALLCHWSWNVTPTWADRSR